MTDPNTISEELKDLQSSLAGTGRPAETFAVPPGYFEGFADRMLAKVRSFEATEELSGLSPVLAGIPKSNGFAVPAGYFESLDPMAANHDEESLSPLLQGLKNTSKENPYSIPAGYFESLDPMVAVQRTPAKVISMGSFNWKRYVAAASVVAVVSLGTFFYVNRNSSPSADAIVASAVKEAPAKELDNFFRLDDDITENNRSGKNILASVRAQDAKEISNLVKNVPVKDLQAFLNDTEGAESDIDDDPLLN